ncbi:ABC1-domain-containing protein [Poronia punctata]|nr:ABC1-domain-containing protein [Poronia punctata]
MRFGDIILDLAAVAKVSRSVASRHLELRAKQIDRYGQTSSIIRSLRKESPPSPSPASETGQPDFVAKDATEEKKRARKDSPPDVRRVISSSASVAAAPRLDQSDILAQLREKAAEPADAPSDIPAGIFHTRRGSQLLGSQKDPLGQLRSKAPPPEPSWFKDFGHDKQNSESEAGSGTPTIPESRPVVSVQRDVKSADVAVKSPVSKVTVVQKQGDAPTALDKKEVPETEIPTPSTTGQAEAQPDVNKTEVEEKEQIQAVKDILSGEEPTTSEPTVTPYALRESKVPATRLSRLWNYGGLAAGMLGGALTEGVMRGFGGGSQGPVIFSPGNVERLVAKLSRMRGAALKLGQMMSFQDSKMLPAPLQEVLQRVQDRADYMPAWQRDRVLVQSLGADWRSLFSDFDEKPIAAASIGQVHRATLSTGEKVAVKIQFPGVADSINSDLDNISMLLTASKMLPKGLYLNKTIDNARTELGWECDYERELACGQRYKSLLSSENDVFSVPEIYAHASGKHVLTMQFMNGIGVTRVKSFTQPQRDWIGTQILRLCLREIAEFRFMQTDPNWTNFLYNSETNKLELLDFGASREFPDDFVTQYLSLLSAAARRDRDAVIDHSQRLGYLTGHESRAMLDAHVASILTLAEPFLQSAPEVYDFADQTITERVRDLIPVMVRERLSPPPEETYSLHRKLSGAFLLCARLGSRVRCRDLFRDALDNTDLPIERK